MQSEIKVFNCENGEIQRVQVVRWKKWDNLDFMYMDGNENALKCFRDIYANYLVPGCPWVFGNMILFQLPKDSECSFSFKTKKYGNIEDKLTAATIAIKEGVKIVGGRPIFKNKAIKDFWKQLEEKNSVFIVCGKLPYTKVIPVGDYAGYLSQKDVDAAMKVNASFFIMDSFDCASVFDHVGKIFGLCVKDGVVMNPPLYQREAFLVKRDGSVTIKELDVKDLEIEIHGQRFQNGHNATIYTRFETSKTPASPDKKIVVVGRKVVAVKEKGEIVVPASGFVLSIFEHEEESVKISPGYEVTYHGLEDIQFGIQVGNSIIREGKKTKEFISKFYNIRKLEKKPYPPSLYPMDFDNGRAARIALGCDENNEPVLFWAEGAGKLHYQKGVDSTGASLKEMAQIAKDLGMVNAVNLDGGGSAQILLENKRSLRISDRNKQDNSDAERLIPMGLILR
ncbi:MAG: phosphodiester glycosidase family protein [Lachnospiraceae bacterium]|nr:phosphodiester glycosidase family protein [Lachnospiraceae bacterium]